MNDELRPVRRRRDPAFGYAAAMIALFGGAALGFAAGRQEGSRVVPAPVAAIAAPPVLPSITHPPHPVQVAAIPAAAISAHVQAAVNQGIIKGGVVLVTAPGVRGFVRAFGVDAAGRPIRPDAVFDIASLTKVVATAPLVLSLVAEGRFTLETPIRRWFPWFRPDMGRITVGQLLTHTSGLPAGLSGPVTNPPEVAISRVTLRSLPGKHFEYSDLGYLLLGRIVELETGERLDVAARDRIFRPVGMVDTTFRPRPSSRIAATVGDHDEILRGTVQDPLSRKLGGVAGNAGVFSTAQDLNQYARVLLAGGRVGNHVALPYAVVRWLTDPISIDPRITRAYGMDILTPFSSPKGDLLPFGSFGHTGYTGCSLWADRESGAVIILLSTGKSEETTQGLNELRRTLANLVAGSEVAVDSG